MIEFLFAHVVAHLHAFSRLVNIPPREESREAIRQQNLGFLLLSLSSLILFFFCLALSHISIESDPIERCEFID